MMDVIQYKSFGHFGHSWDMLTALFTRCDLFTFETWQVFVVQTPALRGQACLLQ